VTWSISGNLENWLIRFIPLPLFVFSRISEPFKIPPVERPDWRKFQEGWIGKPLYNLIWKRVSKDQLRGLPEILNPAPRLLIDDLQSNGIARDVLFVKAVKEGRINILKGHQVKQLTENSIITD
jgi:hypothetical protein